MCLYRIQVMLLAILSVGFVGCDKEDVSMTNETSSEMSEQNTGDFSKATFAGGCFWGVEHNFRRVPGVLSTEVGFMGGRTDNPSYKEICYEDTNHAEVVQLSYDPKKISYEKLVKVFFKLHDPTTMNRQGPDVGSQYRSAIFYHDETQKRVAKGVKADLTAAGEFNRSIVTEIASAKEFWIAEDYHQQYIEKNPLRSCHIVDHREIQRILDED